MAYLQCEITITGAGLKPAIVIDMDPTTGESRQVYEIGQQPVVTVKELGDISVHPEFLNTCLQIYERLQKLPKQKLLTEK
jgi:hypothetical protein